ncbi:nitroreductase family protein [Oscillibacter sp. MSJ-2]|uniref:Nitroreductase family protein n=1 Tax=Dysosmobacter acutus TaxID=2841504 RepID=A0ABS6F934_9FIRM|nr:nitroreductase family protein [Dysosmobacter acutus]MBU5626775.1 nitroreductase family protein [Dysosmobacter acutus]
MDYFKAVKSRYSCYDITGKSTISDSRLKEMLNDAVSCAPSSFNSHSSRLVLLLQSGHETLWNIVLEALRPMVPEEKFPNTEKKIGSFAAGYGTILFYEDQETVRGLQEKYPLYSENFPLWAEQGSAMLQYIVWTGLEAEGLGASLQHYNPLIDREAAAAFDIPDHWKLIAQMPFGVPAEEHRGGIRKGEDTWVRVVEKSGRRG